MNSGSMKIQAIAVLALGAFAAVSPAANRSHDTIRHVVDHAVAPVMAQYRIPGMAVGVIVAGKPYAFNYGVASKQTRRPVSRDTLFELGSISKTFAATLASCAQADGDLSLSDPAGKYLPSLKGSAFGDVTVLQLGTTRRAGFRCRCPTASRTTTSCCGTSGSGSPPTRRERIARIPTRASARSA